MTRIKAASIALIMVVLVCLATACTEEKKPSDPVEIHYQVLFEENDTSPLANRYRDAVADFNELHPNIKVIMDYITLVRDENGVAFFSPEDAVKLIEKDNAPDVMPWFTSNLNMVRGKAQFRDLLSLVPDQLDIPQSILNTGMADGELLVLPYGAVTNGIYFNKQLFDEAQLPYPEGEWTWQQYRNVSTAMKDKGSLLSYDLSTLGMLLASTGNGMVSPDGLTTVGYLDSPESVRIVQWLNDWYRDVDQSKALSYFELFPQFDSSQRGMFYGNMLTHFFSFEGDNRKMLGVAPMPYFEGGHRVNESNFMAYGISRKSKHPEAAWELIQYLTLENNKHSLQFAEEYIPTSQAMADAVKIQDDPIKRVFYEELKYVQQDSNRINPLFNQAVSGPIQDEFIKLLTADDDEIESKLHELARLADTEMNRLKLESEKSSENAG